ncbi:hypothetical protein [Desulfosporosinus sp. I2]|uniref:hypothetical protein n=1 Tax=Desulfosporosinus sp. I2 TaxID=1617025 RepID=UPI0012E0836C|nr:hypothetical protein [Desulfosporosinus sp. I2]
MIELPQLSMPSKADSTTEIQTDNTANSRPESLTGPKNLQPTPVASAKTWLNWHTSALAWMIGVSAISSYLLLINLLLLFKIKKLPVCDSEDSLRILEECQSKLKVRSKVSVVDYETVVETGPIISLRDPAWT